MKKIQIPNLKLCTGCRICEMTCSLFKEGTSSSNLSRIRVYTDYEEGRSRPVPCYQCEDAPCAEACPVDAIRRNPRGFWFVDPDDCFGCSACVEACPFGSIQLHPETGVAMKCDNCGGNPQCVDKCPTDCLKYMNSTETRDKKAEKFGKENIKVREEEGK